MSEDSKKDMFSRRGFLGVGSAALAAAGMLSVADAGAQDQNPNPTNGNRSKSDPGPKNAEPPPGKGDSQGQPATDSKSLGQTLKNPFSFANKRTYEGGGAAGVTV